MEQLLENIRTNESFPDHFFLSHQAVLFSEHALSKNPGDENLQLWLSIHKLNAGKTQEALSGFERLQNAKNPEVARRAKAHIPICWIRMAEAANCQATHGPESCIFPLQGGGVHQHTEPAKKAVEVLENRAREADKDPFDPWLLHLARAFLGQKNDEFNAFQHFPDRLVPFSNLAPALGVDVTGLAGAAAIEDFNNDGLQDLFVTDMGVDRAPKFFLQVKGPDGNRFEDRSQAAGLSKLYGGLNFSLTDYNNDGFTDVYIARGGWLNRGGKHPNSLLKNNGDATFSDVTFETGLLSFFPTQSSVWADFNRDGFLDLFIANETMNDTFPCELYLNDKKGKFISAAREAGLHIAGFFKSTVGADFDGNGYPDLFVSAYEQPNRLLLNTGVNENGIPVFKSEPGLEEPISSFTALAADFNHDGRVDLVVSDYFAIHTEPKHYFEPGEPTWRHYQNMGGAKFKRVENGRPHLGAMGMNAGDFDNDGFADIRVGTGNPDLRSVFPNLLMLNKRESAWADVAFHARTGHLQKGHGVAVGDIDNDGDDDFYESIGGFFPADTFPNALFINNNPVADWIGFDLHGTESPRYPIGASVKITLNVGERYLWFGTGSGFGNRSRFVTLCLNKGEKIKNVEVRWPSGKIQSLGPLSTGKLHRVTEMKSVSSVERELAKWKTGAGAACH